MSNFFQRNNTSLTLKNILILLFGLVITNLNAQILSSNAGSLSNIYWDCCDQGNAVNALTFTYTGESCSNSNNTQGNGADCHDFDGGIDINAEVFIAISNNQDGDTIYFTDFIEAGDVFTANATGNSFNSEIHIGIFDVQSLDVLQYIEMHTSCSEPLVVGEQFGSLILDAVSFNNGSICEIISGCTDPLACNYNADANSDDGTCDPGEPICQDPCNVIFGCTDPEADNYNAIACFDDGSCINSDTSEIIITYDAPDGFLNFYCDSFSTDVPRWALNITAVNGGSGNYYVEPYGDGVVSCPFITEGNGFTFSFTANDQLTGNVGFKITDGTGLISYLDPQILLSLTFLWSPDLFCQTNISYNYCQNYYTLKDEFIDSNIDITAKNFLNVDNVYFNNASVNLIAGNSINIMEIEISQNTNLNIEIGTCID